MHCGFFDLRYARGNEPLHVAASCIKAPQQESHQPNTLASRGMFVFSLSFPVPRLHCKSFMPVCYLQSPLLCIALASSLLLFQRGSMARQLATNASFATTRTLQ